MDRAPVRGACRFPHCNRASRRARQVRRRRHRSDFFDHHSEVLKRREPLARLCARCQQPIEFDTFVTSQFTIDGGVQQRVVFRGIF
ncbi:MAG TPA: hypothetical protein VK678_10670 [Bradyrhizobium sp.]|nr:hypothetical protein [Bradyrhizobium sp.]